MALDKKPDFKKIEPKWQKWWAKEDIYAFDVKSKKPLFSIDSPPPTVSSDHIHEGHAMSYTQFEMVSRYKRMRGFNVFIPMGFDDNGLPTERFFEKKLKIDARKMPANDFRKIIQKEMLGTHKSMRADFDLLGHAYDWNYSYSTSNKSCSKAAQMSFIDLHKKNLVYRSEEPTLWCPRCMTAAAQADIESEDRKGVLNYVNFKLTGGGSIQIATSRPELLPACVAMAVHPDDERYKKYVGKKAIVPLFDYEVKIIKDEKVDPEFGTGVVMICTFGDTSDVEWWRAYKLPLKIVITPDGKMNELAGKYEGLSIKDAKEKILGDLKKNKVVEKQEIIQQSVGVCWRCPTPIEFIVTPQWFVKLLGHEDEFLKQGAKVNWVPKLYKVRYDTWIEGLKWDWIISRQRPHGIPIPIWYCKKCNIGVLPDEKDLPVDPRFEKFKGKCSCGGTDFIGEKDIFDTWMTSSLTPEFALGWGQKKNLMDKLFPMDLRPQAHDIIRTWAFYTIAKAWYHFKKLPWKNAMVSGHVLDSKGRKISKSLGNSINFHGIVEKHSADQFRYWTATATLGEDLSFQEKELIRAGKILLKIWNACKFFEMHMDALPVKKPNLEALDEWILIKLSRTLSEYLKFFDKFEYMHARKEVEMFFMHDFADDYLEMIKYRLYGDDKKSKEAAVWTVHNILLNVLKMFAPITPHITEELYQALFKKKEGAKSIHLSLIPDETMPKSLVTDEEIVGGTIRDVVALIRKYKSDNNLSLGKEVESLIVEHPRAKDLDVQKEVVQRAIRVKKITFKESSSIKVY